MGIIENTLNIMGVAGILAGNTLLTNKNKNLAIMSFIAGSISFAMYFVLKKDVIQVGLNLILIGINVVNLWRRKENNYD